MAEIRKNKKKQEKNAPLEKVAISNHRLQMNRKNSCREGMLGAAPVFASVNGDCSHFFHQRLIFWLLFYQEKSNMKNAFLTSLLNGNLL